MFNLYFIVLTLKKLKHSETCVKKLNILRFIFEFLVKYDSLRKLIIR